MVYDQIMRQNDDLHLSEHSVGGVSTVYDQIMRQNDDLRHSEHSVGGVSTVYDQIMRQNDDVTPLRAQRRWCT